MAKWTETGTCPVCGRSWLQERTGKGGRLRVYCDDDCKMVYSVLGSCEKLVDRVADRCTEAKWRSIRSRLWGIGNLRGSGRKRARR